MIVDIYNSQETHGTAMTSLDDQAQVRRKCTRISGPCSLLIRVRRRQIIGELSWPLEHLANVVWAVFILDLLGQSFHLVDGVRDADEVAPGNAVEGMASCTDFAIDLVAASDAFRTNSTSDWDQKFVMTIG